jgi:hypothetical protein
MLRGNVVPATFAVCLALLFGLPQARADIIYADFSSGAGLALNGNVSGVPATGPSTGNVLRLTTGVNQSGTAWFTTKQEVQSGFETTFQFRITPLSGFNTEPSADGFTFMIQNTGTNVFGGAGDGIGYGGIANSVAVEFDTFCNGPATVLACYNQGNGINDPNGNHIEVHTNGTGINTQQSIYRIGTATTAIPVLDNGTIYTARILYVPGTLSIFLDNVPTLTVPLDLATTLALDNGTAFLGFTAGTGSASARHDILNWNSTSAVSIATVPEPSTIVLSLSGLAIMAWMRLRKS